MYGPFDKFCKCKALRMFNDNLNESIQECVFLKVITTFKSEKWSQPMRAVLWKNLNIL